MSDQWTPSKEQWEKMQKSVDKLNLLVGGVEADGSIGVNTEKSMLHVMFRLTETVFGKDSQQDKGLDRRVDALEQSRRDEIQQRRGALWVIGGLGTAFGGATGAIVTWFLHGKKP